MRRNMLESDARNVYGKRFGRQHEGRCDNASAAGPANLIYDGSDEWWRCSRQRGRRCSGAHSATERQVPQRLRAFVGNVDEQAPPSTATPQRRALLLLQQSAAEGTDTKEYHHMGKRGPQPRSGSIVNLKGYIRRYDGSLRTPSHGARLQ